MEAIVITNRVQEYCRCWPVAEVHRLRYQLSTEVTRQSTPMGKWAASALLLILSLAAAGMAEAAMYSGEVTSAPHLEFQRVRASELRLGMEADEVLYIMGERAPRTTFSEGDVQVFSFPAEPLPTKVVLKRNKVTSVSLDITRLDDARLPEFTRQALVGMSILRVRDLLGAPAELRHYELFQTKLDQLVFVRPNEPVISIFFVDDRVITKALGTSIPADIFGVVVPAAPDPSAPRSGMIRASIGASPNDMRVLFGAPDLVVEYSFNRQRAMHAIYHTQDHHALSAYFVGDALTEVTDVGMWSKEDASGG